LIGDDNNIVIDDDDTGSMLSWVSEPTPSAPTLTSKIKEFFKGGSSKPDDMVRDAETAAGMDGPQKLRVSPIAQHYHPDRKLVHDQIQGMRETNLTVAVEQVSIFLTSDGTVITFFQVHLRHSLLILAIRQSSRKTYYAEVGFGKYYTSNIRRSLFVIAEYYRCGC
jgi:hypothetical protein